jgi:adhesin/invasin
MAGCIAAMAALAACESPSGEPAPGPAARLEEGVGNYQAATPGMPLPRPLLVRVVDERGRAVPDEIVTFRVLSGGGSLAEGTVRTNQWGSASDTWTLGTSTAPADSQRVEARLALSGGGAAIVSFRATVTPGPVSVFEVVSGSGQEATAGSVVREQLSVRAADAFGNPVTGATVTWTVRSGGGDVPPTSTTDGGGVAKAGWRLGSVVDAPQAAAATLQGRTAEFTAFAGVTPGTSIIKRCCDGVGTAGMEVSHPLVVRVLHANGTLVVGVPVTWTVSQGGGVVSSSSLTEMNGEASTRWTFPAAAGVYSVRAALSSGAAVTFAGTAYAGAPASIERVTPDMNAAVGLPITLAARVRDAGGNPVPHATVTWAAAGGSLQPATSNTDGFGIAHTSWTMPATVGSYTATASVAGFTTPEPFRAYAGPRAAHP